MLNTIHFVVLAGDPTEWDDEIRAKCRPGSVWGTFDSLSLAAMQEDQHRRGRRSAELLRTYEGWHVRSGSNLDAFQVLATTTQRGGTLDGTKEAAIAWGKAWAEADPKNREFFARKSDL